MNPRHETMSANSSKSKSTSKGSSKELLKDSIAFSSFSVNDIDEARSFYDEILGLDVSEVDEMGTITITFANGNELFIYPKPEHEPATFTVLNFPVSDIEATVEEFKNSGIIFEQYDGELKTDKNGIFRDNGHAMAWFKDPSGNIISILEMDDETNKNQFTMRVT